jgi:hypothetical protein
MSPVVKVFGCRPHDGGAAGTGAGVRNLPREMLWGGGEDIASIVADVNRWSAHSEVERSEPIPEPVLMPRVPRKGT